MGGGSSTAALALPDVVRARERLLVSLLNTRKHDDSALSAHTRLLHAFQRFDSVCAPGRLVLCSAVYVCASAS